MHADWLKYRTLVSYWLVFLLCAWLIAFPICEGIYDAMNCLDP